MCQMRCKENESQWAPEEEGASADRVVREGFRKEMDFLLNLERKVNFGESEIEVSQEGRITSPAAVVLKLVFYIPPSHFYAVCYHSLNIKNKINTHLNINLFLNVNVL